MAQSEVNKLRQHIALLKQEYSKLQAHCVELERKYDLAAAAAGEPNETSFAARLLSTVASLHERETYSDVKIKLSDGVVPAHRIVLRARSDERDGVASHEDAVLDWSDLDAAAARATLRWMYTDSIDASRDDRDVVALMRAACRRGLSGLVVRCERTLIDRADVRTCVGFYSAADETGATALRDHCSALISARWDDLTGSDFADVSGPALYEMLKEKTDRPLHSAVRLGREDVVFLFLVERDGDSSQVVNEWSPSGDLPLEQALRNGHTSIAATLAQHAADVNVRDETGDTLLLRALRRGDARSALFLLAHGADASAAATAPPADTPLHLIAATTSDAMPEAAEIAERIVEAGAHVNAQNTKGFTALHVATMCRNEPVADLLLGRADLDPNVTTAEDEHTALYFALTNDDGGGFALADKLVRRGATADPIYSTSGDGLLHELARRGLAAAADFVASRTDDVDRANRRGETALHVACKHGPAGLVSSLLAHGSDPNALDADGRGPLHVAVKHDQEGCVAAFVEHNRTASGVPADMNLRDADGDTPLGTALVESFDELVGPLVDGGADVDVRNGSGFTMLHRAILKEDAKTALFLIERGADVDAPTPENETPLQLAVHCRLADVVEALCVRGVDTGRLDAHGSPPLWAALSSDQEDVASVLVRHGADPDRWGPGPDGCLQTLLHRAIDENLESAAVFLVRAGCDRDSPRRAGADGRGGDLAADGRSPLHLCCRWGLERVAQTLIEHGANVDARDAEMKTPLHVAIENARPAIVSLLLCHPNVDLRPRDNAGRSAFATALTFRDDAAAQAILDRMPQAAEQVDGKGRNFLHTAIEKGDIESVLFLLAVDVDVNARVRDANLTPALHLAARSGDETLVRSLLLAGARPDDRDSRKRTALHAAAEAGRAAIVSALLQNGSDCDAVDADGDNALHVAAREGHLAVARALLTESRLDAEAVNLKGRNPLHELCGCAKDNAAAIAELFLECMPKYPIDRPDLQGDAPLLLAYVRGNGALCRALVEAHACVGAENKQGVTIFNYQVASKRLLRRLLDRLSREAPWAEADVCQECGNRFGLTTRKHHCRHCGRCLCGRCSAQEVPILKFGLNRPVRVCEVCFEVLQTGGG